MHIVRQHIAERRFHRVARRIGIGDDDVCCIIDDEGFVAGAANQGIHTRASDQGVVGASANQCIVASTRVDTVIEIGAGESFVARCAVDIESSCQHLVVRKRGAVREVEVLNRIRSQRIRWIEIRNVYDISAITHANHQRSQSQRDHAGRNTSAEINAAVTRPQHLFAHTGLILEYLWIEGWCCRCHGEHLPHAECCTVSKGKLRCTRPEQIIGMWNHHLDALVVRAPGNVEGGVTQLRISRLTGN